MLNPSKDSPLKEHLSPAKFIDSDHPLIIEFTKKHICKNADDIENAVTLYKAVRDQIAYTPYWDFNDPETFRASNCLKTTKGMCQSKAALLAAAARVANIPTRIGFADVVNHMSSQKFLDLLGTNVFRWHAYTELFLGGKWVKSTPSFDTELCKAFNVPPLEFNGLDDSLFQPINSDNKKFMEYIADHGTYADIPHAQIIAEFKIHYAGAMTANKDLLKGSLQDDIKSENQS